MKRYITMATTYRVTEKIIKSIPNIKIEVWHLAGDTFTVSLQDGKKRLAWGSRLTWKQALSLCKTLNLWGIYREKFEVKGSTTHSKDEINEWLRVHGDIGVA